MTGGGRGNCADNISGGFYGRGGGRGINCKRRSTFEYSEAGLKAEKNNLEARLAEVNKRLNEKH
jgi:hypothetical protein